MSLTIVNKRCPEETSSDYAYRLIRRNIMNLYLKPGAVLNEKMRALWISCPSVAAG